VPNAGKMIGGIEGIMSAIGMIGRKGIPVYATLRLKDTNVPRNRRVPR
jgi:hypothetical protein